jgi:predicted DNA-binding ribbon-helix-helix protein
MAVRELRMTQLVDEVVRYISKMAHCLAALVRVGVLELLAKQNKKSANSPKFNPNPGQILPKTPIQPKPQFKVITTS